NQLKLLLQKQKLAEESAQKNKRGLSLQENRLPTGNLFFLPLYTYGVEDKCIFSIIVIQKYVKKALEWRRETWQKSICAVRAKRVRYLVSALGFFDAFTARNGSAFVFTFAFPNFHKDWYFPSAPVFLSLFLCLQ
ncbi:MAG: hypothetical protein IIU30_08445, partial [Treponema sp.]|nr:hypothetical protein [Treponema sp.]